MWKIITTWWNGTSISAKVLNFTVRHSTWILGLIIVLWISHFMIAKIDTLVDVLTWVFVGIGLGGIGSFAITRHKWFVKQDTDSDLLTAVKHVVGGMIVCTIIFVTVLGAGLLHYINVDKEVIAEKQASIDSAKVLKALPLMDTTYLIKEKK